MVKPKTLLINKYFILLTLGFLYFSTWAQNQAIQDSLPFDAVIQEERQGLLTKFYGNTRFTLNQAYFSNWITGGESSITTLFALDYNLNLSNRRGLVWDNNVLLSLGSTYISGDKFVKKADDRLEINSLVGKQISYRILSMEIPFSKYEDRKFLVSLFKIRQFLEPEKASSII